MCDLSHPEVAILLLDPASTLAAIRRYAARNRAGEGQVARFVLGRSGTPGVR